jgi:hypothetical protein
LKTVWSRAVPEKEVNVLTAASGEKTLIGPLEITFS